MADGFIQVPPDSTGKKVDQSELVVGINTVERQRINIADPATDVAIAPVKNADPGSSDYGLTVRDVRGNATTPVRVDPTGTTVQPVSGTVTANIGTGSLAGITATVVVKADTAGNQANALKVDGSAVTQPVSGTVSVNALPTGSNVIGSVKVTDGTNTGAVKAASTAAVATDPAVVVAVSPNNSVAVTGTFWQATQPVSAASLPLPTGAATAAKQPALGTAGTASTDVITIQGIASMTAVKVDGSAVTQPVSGTVTVQQSTASNLKVDLSGTAANATAIKVDNSGVTQPVSGTVTANQGGTWTVQPGNTANTTPWLVSEQASTSGGWSVSSQTALTNTKVAVKASGGNFGGYMLYNPNASAVFIQVFDVASASVTLGTTAPTYVIALPATAAANVEFRLGITHSTAITLAATTTATGSAAPGTALTGFFLYK